MLAAEIAGASFHAIRQTTASWMVKAGQPLKKVGGILGHTTAQTTMQYAHLQPEELRDSISALGAAIEMDTPVGKNASRESHGAVSH